MGIGRRTLWSAVVPSLLVLAQLAAPAKAAEAPSLEKGPLRNPDYVGHVRGTADSRIALKFVAAHPGRTVEIRLHNVRQVCEDGTSRVSYGFTGIEADRAGRFEARIEEGPAQPFELFGISWVRGRADGDRARGMLAEYTDPYDPPSGDNNADECWIDAASWRAHRTRERERESVRPASRSDSLHGDEDHQGRPAVYTGSMLDLRDRPYLLRVTVTPDSRRAKFVARVTVDCEGRERRKKIGPIPVTLGAVPGTTRFRSVKEHSTRLVYVDGRFAGRSLRGSFAYLRDPWDPEGEDNRAECGTPPVLSWKARR